MPRPLSTRESRARTASENVGKRAYQLFAVENRKKGGWSTGAAITGIGHEDGPGNARVPDLRDNACAQHLTELAHAHVTNGGDSDHRQGDVRWTGCKGEGVSPRRQSDCDSSIRPANGSSFHPETVITSCDSAPLTPGLSRSKSGDPEMRGRLTTALISLALGGHLVAQTLAQFEVVSIKRHVTLDANSGIQNLPDGTTIAINQPISSLISGAAPVQVREVVGGPDWLKTERYDVTTKPPAGSTPAQRREMVRRMFAERMKLVAHIEQRERDTFALLLARADGRLGPNLKPSAPECMPRPAGAPARPSSSIHRCPESLRRVVWARRRFFSEPPRWTSSSSRSAAWLAAS
jgi:hypothetical protein